MAIILEVDNILGQGETVETGTVTGLLTDKTLEEETLEVFIAFH